MSLPNFIIFGTRKAGTTSLYHYLWQHPEIYMSTLKGSRFFLYDPAEPERGKNLPIRTLEAYAKLFAGADKKRAKAIGEASPTYINSSMAARRIKATLPNVRLIASLRNPVDRTYSRYQVEMRYRRDADRIPLSVDNIPRWADAGLYFKYLKHYFDIFDPSQIKIIIFEEWKTDPLAMLKDVYRFLEVDENFVPNLKTTYNLARPGGRRVHPRHAPGKRTGPPAVREGRDAVQLEPLRSVSLGLQRAHRLRRRPGDAGRHYRGRR